MRAMRCVAAAAVVIAALAPAPARAADGTITSVSASPSPATKNQTVTITVLGTGKCKTVNVDFGDSTPDAVLDNPDFDDSDASDNSVTHAYASAGSYTILATAVAQCTGSANKALTVNEGGSGQTGVFKGKLPKQAFVNVCAILGTCNPVLEALFPFSVIEPGGDVLVFGHGFGTMPGELHLVLKTDGKDIKLTNKEWGEGYVGAKIPGTTYGVVDQPGEFYVKTSTGSESNRKGPVSFTAKRGVHFLQRGEAFLVSCSNDSNCDQCLEQRDTSDGNCFSGVPDQGAVAGYHYNCWACIGNDSGQDVYSPVPLKNGWVLDSVSLVTSVAPGEGSASASISQGKVRVNWSVTPNDGVSYAGYVLIKGPMLTPYK